MSTEIKLVRRSRPQGGVAEIWLARPAKGNALTFDMIRALADVVREIAADASIGVVVVRGEGRYFCTGGDVASWSALTPAAMRDEWIAEGLRAFAALAALPQPVIAALHGSALGGGLELALHADLRLARTEATFGTPEVKLGMIAGWGGVRRLAETIGVARARQLTLLGEPILAQQALDWGIVTAVAETPEQFESMLDGWIDRLLANGPAALALTKGLLADVHADRIAAHAEAAARALVTEDCAEGVRAFREKRTAVFRRQNSSS